MTSTRSSPDLDRVAQFQRLMRLGQVSYAEGNTKQAHRFWRRAAMLNPTDEQVWLVLLSVLDNNEDRRVCLQNIVAINPNNLQAQERLNAFYDETQPERPNKPLIQPLPPQRRNPVGQLLLRLLQIMLFSGLLVLGFIALQYLLVIR